MSLGWRDIENMGIRKYIKINSKTNLGDLIDKCTEIDYRNTVMELYSLGAVDKEVTEFQELHDLYYLEVQREQEKRNSF